MNKAVFLDRDGTLNSDSSYINRAEDFVFYPFTVKALEILKKSGFLLIIISNQSGVGRGIISETELIKINEKMQKELNKAGIGLDDIYYCFYYEKSSEKKYLLNAGDRKPEPGMILKAADKFKINLNESFFIGDRETDIQAGKKSGCKTVLVKTGDGLKTLDLLKNSELNITPDFIFESILEAAAFISGCK